MTHGSFSKCSFPSIFYILLSLEGLRGLEPFPACVGWESGPMTSCAVYIYRILYASIYTNRPDNAFSLEPPVQRAYGLCGRKPELPEGNHTDTDRKNVETLNRPAGLITQYVGRQCESLSHRTKTPMREKSLRVFKKKSDVWSSDPAASTASNLY